MADDLADEQRLKTLLGDELLITLDNGQAFINGIRIVQTDVEATNGIVHIVEDVLIPGNDDQIELKSIPELLISTPGLSILQNALEQTNLISDLSADGPYTVFAPSNEAFFEVSLLGISDLKKIPNFLLKKLLMYHVVSGLYTAENLSENPFLHSVTGFPLTISYQEETLFVNNAEY
ncbi:MAG: fasciclin domain-containing protein [Cyclobacteriaceae bacterium]